MATISTMDLTQMIVCRVHTMGPMLDLIFILGQLQCDLQVRIFIVLCYGCITFQSPPRKEGPIRLVCSRLLRNLSGFQGKLRTFPDNLIDVYQRTLYLKHVDDEDLRSDHS